MAACTAPRRRRARRPAAPALSVVVPAWNEAERIGECLDRLWACLRSLSAEVVVVDDGSSDGTAEACAAWMRRHPGAPVLLLRRPHRGKGAAVYAGARATRGDAIAYLDADLDVPAEEVARLFALRRSEGLDVLVGSKRRLTWRESGRPPLRTALSIAFSWLARSLFRLPIRDTQTGIKLWPGPWLRATAREARVRGFLFDLELLGAAAADGLRLAEVGVEVRMRRPASRLGLADVGRCLLELPSVGASLRARRRRGAPPALRPRRRRPVSVHATRAS
jgi:glycosyltransferase involved in cell wall biosynthesis